MILNNFLKSTGQKGLNHIISLHEEVSIFFGSLPQVMRRTVSMIAE